MHFPGFEGLRALAAVMVVVHHAFSISSPPRDDLVGRMAAVMDSGVAVFFVISGFLIYRPFVRADVDGRPGPGWASFWWRRVLRIVPAYWAALTILWATGSFALGVDWWRYYLFLQIYDRYTSLGGIIQAWSLSTEMTFYLLVPLWALLVGRAARGRGPRGALVAHLAGTGVLFGSGYLFRLVVSEVEPSWQDITFTWLPANVDLFAVGMGLAVLSAWAAHDQRVGALAHRLAGPSLAWGIGAVAIFLLFALWAGPAPGGRYVGGYWQQRQALVGAMSLLLLVPSVFGDQARGALRRLLQLGPVAWTGVLSYGLYLWHLDLIKRSVDLVDASFQPRTDGWLPYREFDAPVLPLLAVGLGLGLVAAALSWYLLERPLQRRWKDRF